MLRRQPRCTLCPYTTLFRSTEKGCERATRLVRGPAMSARSYAGGLALGVVAVAAISSCSFTNDIDACDKSVPASVPGDRKSTRLNSSHLGISYAVFCLKNKR